MYAQVYLCQKRRPTALGARRAGTGVGGVSAAYSVLATVESVVDLRF